METKHVDKQTTDGTVHNMDTIYQFFYSKGISGCWTESGSPSWER